MSEYVPIAGDHAIDQAIVGVRLLSSASDVQFQNAVQLASLLARERDLPGRLQLDPLSLVFGRQLISPGYATRGDLSPGHVFQKVNSDGSMGEELTLERNAVTYRTRSYTRWRDVVANISGILIPVVSALIDSNADLISVIELRCIDIFRSDRQDIELSNLICRDNPFIPNTIVSKSEMLHCHIGWFENQTDSGRTLVNLHLDVVDQPDGGRMASLLQVVSRQSSGTGSYFAVGENFEDLILNEFKYLHRYDKYILSNILTSKTKNIINLDGESGTNKP